MRIELTVNERKVMLDVPPSETLLTSLRERLHLTGAKEACVEGECGACTVLLNGRPVDSCIYPTAASSETQITTVEGLRGTDGKLSPLQQAFVDHFAVQCGFCTPGMVMTALAIVKDNPNPSDADIRHGLEGNLCRCTGYQNIIKAVIAGAKAMRG